jgi:hypothetical protein
MAILSSNRSSLETPTDIRSDDPFLDTLSFKQIGPSRLFYQWSFDIHSTFLDWWLETEWIQENASDTINWPKKLAWDSVTKKSTAWERFYQAAHQITGEPVLICRTCSTKLSHPNVKGTGTTALTKHISSSQCSQRSKSQGQGGTTKQLRLDEISVVPVSAISIKISRNSNIYSPYG